MPTSMSEVTPKVIGNIPSYVNPISFYHGEGEVGTIPTPNDSSIDLSVQGERESIK